jgi:PAS domain S-box-containing protein
MSPVPKAYLEHLAELSPDIIVAVDRHGKITFYNDGARSILGYSPEEVLGQKVTLLYGSLDEARRVMAAMRNKQTSIETTLRSKSGQEIAIIISGTIMRDASGVEVGSIGFAKDLREIRKHARLVTLGEIAVSIAHEINNPLEAIGNHLELVAQFLTKKCTDEEFVVEGERLDAIQRELDNIQDTVHRIQEAAGETEYDTVQYMPGRKMTDLRAKPDGRAGHPLDGMRVLVVDDDRGVCNSLRDVLQAESCEVFTAGGGTEALKVLDEKPVDVLLSDVVMPDMDGYELFMEVRERRPSLPVVLMTAYYYDKDHVIKRSRLEGLDQVIFKKPIDPKRLMAVLERVSGRAANSA